MWEVILNDLDLTPKLRRRLTFLREKVRGNLQAPSITIEGCNTEVTSKDNCSLPNKGVGSIALKQKKSQAPRSKVPRDIEEVYEYGTALGLPREECRLFWLHFENNGWKQSGKTPMKDWKLACQKWHITWCKSAGKNPDPDYKPKAHRPIILEEPVEISEPGAVVSSEFKQKMDRLLGKVRGGE